MLKSYNGVVVFPDSDPLPTRVTCRWALAFQNAMRQGSKRRFEDYYYVFRDVELVAA